MIRTVYIDYILRSYDDDGGGDHEKSPRVNW